jgi:DNA-directed RNA polymerase II subunit RPB9
MANLWGEDEEDDFVNTGEGEEEDILDMEGRNTVYQEGALLMRFCPHDSSMLYPQVSDIVDISISRLTESITHLTGMVSPPVNFNDCCYFEMIFQHKEDKSRRSLRYACRLCRYTEDAADQPLVYRNERKKEVGNILHTVPSAVSDDPTLARSNKAHCTNCGHNEAVFFQSDVAQSDSLALIFVCCNCDHKWMN